MVYRGLKEPRYWGSSSKTWVVTEAHLADFVPASLVSQARLPRRVHMRVWPTRQQLVGCHTLAMQFQFQ